MFIFFHLLYWCCPTYTYWCFPIYLPCLKPLVVFNSYLCHRNRFVSPSLFFEAFLIPHLPGCISHIPAYLLSTTCEWVPTLWGINLNRLLSEKQVTHGLSCWRFVLVATPAAEDGAAAPAGDAPADGKPPHDNKHQAKNDGERWNPSCLWFNVYTRFSQWQLEMVKCRNSLRYSLSCLYDSC